MYVYHYGYNEGVVDVYHDDEEEEQDWGMPYIDINTTSAHDDDDEY